MQPVFADDRKWHADFPVPLFSLERVAKKTLRTAGGSTSMDTQRVLTVEADGILDLDVDRLIWFRMETGPAQWKPFMQCLVKNRRLWG